MSAGKTTKGTMRAFDVDFAHCSCEGTVHKQTRMRIIPVRWKRKSSGQTRFQCMRCKQSWSMNDVPAFGGGLVLDATHPEEVARRRAIHQHYNEVVAVNINIGSCR